MMRETLRRLLWGRLDRWRKRRARPTVLSVEPTNRCNLNCPFCLAGLQNSLGSTEHSELRRPFGSMDPGLYHKIVADAVAFGIREIQLHFQGEPLLHPGLPKMVSEAHQAGLRTQLFTNGTLLDRARAEALVHAGIDCIRFSVDGATAETYAANRVGGDFGVVVENMKAACDVVRGSGRTVRLIWQFIAMRNNEHELEAAREMAGRTGLDFVVKPFAPSVPELVPRNPRLRRTLEIKPCRDIRRALFVFWNGDVVICCYDQEGRNVLGNMGEHSLDEIWNGQTARRLRRRIEAASRRPDAEPEMCRSCLKWSHYPWKTSDGLTRWEPGEETETE